MGRQLEGFRVGTSIVTDGGAIYRNGDEPTADQEKALTASGYKFVTTEEVAAPEGATTMAKLAAATPVPEPLVNAPSPVVLTSTPPTPAATPPVAGTITYPAAEPIPESAPAPESPFAGAEPVTETVTEPTESELVAATEPIE